MCCSLLHAFGVAWPCDSDLIIVLTAQHDLKLIEDLPQACWRYKGRRVGNIGNIGALILL